jgi:hypothetical protein
MKKTIICLMLGGFFSPSGRSTTPVADGGGPMPLCLPTQHCPITLAQIVAIPV